MRRTILILALPLGLTACDTDPFARPGTLRATGVNQANLLAMLVEPDHARMGIGAGDSSGPAAADAVDRLLAGERYPLAESFTKLSGE
ncbi:hypothetical protein [Geminicoccus roseus]|uniref:hypothetical protein n=1 Tax=Geminicoccus roseus TaxID=404900 RepID=UPI00040C42B3|nr:hypothetical protein [Geminicoccus roseus]